MKNNSAGASGGENAAGHKSQAAIAFKEMAHAFAQMKETGQTTPREAYRSFARLIVHLGQTEPDAAIRFIDKIFEKNWLPPEEVQARWLLVDFLNDQYETRKEDVLAVAGHALDDQTQHDAASRVCLKHIFLRARRDKDPETREAAFQTLFRARP